MEDLTRRLAGWWKDWYVSTAVWNWARDMDPWRWDDGPLRATRLFSIIVVIGILSAAETLHVKYVQRNRGSRSSQQLMLHTKSAMKKVFSRWLIYHLETQFHILSQDTVQQFITETRFHILSQKHSFTFYHKTQFNNLPQRHSSTFYHRDIVAHFITRHSSTFCVRI